jgi:hypothetical protein
MDSSSFFRDILYNLYMYVYNNSEFFNERIITALFKRKKIATRAVGEWWNHPSE